MRKLIRVAAVAFLVWAITTFAWAAIHHVTGVTGPAEASGASLNFVASAVTFVDPPGVLGAPQRFAARQLRQAADAISRIHRGPERLAAQLVDEMGHRHRHRHGRRGGRHRAYVVSRAPVASANRNIRFSVPIDASIAIDELDQARSHARARAVIELDRHRVRIDRERGRLELRRDLSERQRERLEQSLVRVRDRLDRVQSEQDGEFRRKLGKKLREILRELEKELGEVRVTEGQDAPVRIRIRGR
ncbi:MAG: hypothetical protein ACC682_06720 [Gemmatimonadota bacterium]